MKTLLNPRTIAVIGASEHFGKVGYALMRNLKEFNGEVIPINSKHKIIWARKSYGSILDIKKKVDLAIIAIPAKFVAKELIKCGKAKIKNVIIISAGFSEQGDIKAESEIVKIASKFKINLLGPNCFGIANPYLHLDTTFAKTHVNKGNIAVISQSGALWSYIVDWSANKKFGFSGFVSLGNMAGLNFSDFIEYFSKDTQTKAIILYIEKLKQGQRFIKAAKACKKPIYVVKAGSSKQGSQAAISHTGSLATDHEIYKGAFKQAKTILCSSLLQALEKASNKTFRKSFSKIKIKLKKDQNIVIITNAGGAGTLAADYLAEKNIQAKVIDILGTALAEDYKKAIKKYKKENLLILLTPQLMTQISETAQVIVKSRYKKVVTTCFLGGKSIHQACKIFKKAKIPCLNTLEELRKNLAN